MSIVFLLSVILKGLGAVLEVLLQVMITRMLGLAGYGTYSTWVSAADLVYWVLFSGITKCNTFYLSNKGTELRRFKAKYYSCYVLPVLTTLALVLALEKGRGGYTVIALITGMELLVMDHSSTMMAQGQPGCALFGEYVLGRLFLVLGTLVLYKTERLSLGTIRGNPGAFPDKAGQRTPEGYLEGTFFAQMGELSTGGSDTGVDFANANPFAVLFHRCV